ncbi:MAG TPA: MaoC family dehydratase [Pseudothermotoga sp.]|nr:MaoC family dehydratase [Pseudothermotoga sp.]HOK82884.1 MaoC family dehydratase [Pseudothermotoga sp.]HPP69943.1 MaoC family dehydratase [Pseudothermotoga sp.]
MDFSNFQMGQSYSERFLITERMVKEFSELTGDKNPVHLDEDYARSTRFGKRICHGMLAASFISKVLGMNFPGPGTILVKQQLKYRSPVYIDEWIEVQVRIAQVILDRKRLVLDTNVLKEDGTVAIEGICEVLFES